MFLLDTNVVSESRKLASGRADPNVARWLHETPPAQTFLSIFTLLELEVGIQRKARSDPRQGALLQRWLDENVLPGFAGRIIVPDFAITRRCAGLHVPDPANDCDAWIAATALELGLTVVTRNVADFDRSGVALINPWSE